MAFGSSRSTPFAPAAAVQSIRDKTHKALDGFADRPNIVTGGENLLGTDRPNWPSGESLPNKRGAQTDQPRLLDRAQGQTGEGAPHRRSPVVSTLHVDGSTLGRWAIQHLERTLGKPIPGMTGVDPRAAIPRTRISPF